MGSVRTRFTAGSGCMADSSARSCSGCGRSRRRTSGSSAWWPTRRCTSSSCRTNWENARDGRGAAGGRRGVARRRRPERAAGVSLFGCGALESAGSGAPDAAIWGAGAADGARRSAAAVGLSTLVGAAAPRGLCGELEAGLPALPRSRARGQAPAAQACRGRAAPPATRPNERWSMDFVHDRLINGRWFRSLTIVDDFTRECLAIEVDTSLTGARVVEVLTQLALGRPLARSIVVDNGPAFAGRVLDAWAYG